MTLNEMHTTRRYYGWYIVLALAVTETISWGIIYYAFSVFITPMETELGWSRAQLTGGFSLALLVMGGMAFPVGTWIDRHGSRLLMTVGSILASLLVVGWSQVTDITLFYLIWIGLGVCGAAVLYEPAFAVIATWFVQRRTRALAIITFAAGLASTIFVPLSDTLLNRLGWRDAVLALGILLAVTTIPLHALVLRRRPDDLGLLPDGAPKTLTTLRPPSASLSDVLRNRVFWVLTLAFCLASLAATAIRVHFIPFLIDNHVNASTAAFASGAIGLMQVAGRVLFAPLERRFSGRMMVTGIFALVSVAMVALVLGTSLWSIIFFIVVFGAAYGATTLARVSILAELFGSTHFGRISSVMAIFLTIAATSAPFGAGLLYDLFGSYQPVLWIIILLGFAASTVALLGLKDPKANLAPDEQSIEAV